MTSRWAQRQTEIETALASADSERSALLLQREEFGVPYSEELHAFVMLTEEVARYLTEGLGSGRS